MHRLDTSGFKELYPFGSDFLKIGGLDYHFVDEGEGETAVMVHGNPSWSFLYRNLMLGLRGSCRTVAVDHIGCGMSDKPQDYDYTLARHIDNFEYFMNERGYRDVTLVVHDWGGAIGMGYAVRHPENIRRIVVFNTAAFRSSFIPFRINICRIPVFGDIAIRGFNAFAGAAVHMAVEKSERMTPAVKAGFLAPYDGWANRIATLRFVQDIPMSSNDKSYATLLEVERGLEKLREKPMMIVWGARDFCFTVEFMKRWLEFFPRADARLIPDAGHYVLEDAHERIVPWVRDFMKRTARA